MTYKKISLVLALLLFFVLGFLTSQLFSRPLLETEKVYAVMNGQPIKASVVYEKIRDDLLQLEKNAYAIKKRATEEWIQEKLSPQASPLSFEQIDISDEELKIYLKDRNLILTKISKKDLTNILNNMKLRKAQVAQKKSRQDLLAQAKVVWKLPLPVEKVSLNSGSLASLGSWRAPVRLMVVSNFHCPFCSSAQQNLARIKQKYGDHLKISYRFAMQEPEGSIVRQSAEAAYCADEQGGFWKFHDQMSLQPPKDLQGLLLGAGAAGLNSQNLESCLNDRKKRQEVEKDIRETSEAGIGIAPVFVINGHAIAGQNPMEEISLLIDSFL